MVRVTAIAVGASTFAAAHALEVAAWRRLFAPSSQYAPWFLNSGRAVAFTAACLFVASLVYAIAAKAAVSQIALIVANLVAGAVAAMGAVLAVNGPGTLFPIALAIGGLVAAAACAGGGYCGWWLGSERRSSPQ